MNNFNLMLGSFKETLKINSPKIKLGVGLVSGAATIFFACKGTLKVKKIIDQFNEDLKMIETTDASTIEGVIVSDNAKKKTIFDLYKKTIIKLLRLYSPAIGTGVVSIVCILSAFNELNNRLNSATAAAASILAAYNGLKEKFVEKYGEDEFEKLLNEEYDDVITVNEDGKTTVEKTPKKGIKSVRWPFTILLQQGKSEIWPEGMTPETLISQLTNINNACRTDAEWRYNNNKSNRSLSAENITEKLRYRPDTPAEACYFANFGKVWNPKKPDDDFIIWNKDTQSYEEFLKGSGVLWVSINVDMEPRF